MIKVKSTKPSGWIKSLMQEEVKHHVIDKLPELLPDLFHDDLYAKDRIGPHTRPKDLGTVENDQSWNAQFYWWNSETIGNYYDGLMRYGYLLDDHQMIEKANQFIKHILSSQDDDGYLGIYTPEFRYHFNSENGELWAKTTIGRLLLGYYRYTKDETALTAVQRMTDNLMVHWPIHRSQPFSGTNTFAGVAHGLMFVDVLYELYEITNDFSYIEYAMFLYEDYNQHDVSEPDSLICNLTNEQYRFKGHGVHTYEHLRAIAIYDKFTHKKFDLYHHYMKKLQLVLSPSGGPIGDEWIMGNIADANTHGYEFCSIHELMASLIFVSKIGLDNQSELVRKIYLNANRGSHHHSLQTIAYLKSDNSYAMQGVFHGVQVHSPHKIQTRYKYSPTHQDAAVCCAPNAVRITPYFLDGIIQINDQQVFLNILAPVELEFIVDGHDFYLNIEQETPYQPATIKTNLEDRLVRNDQSIEQVILVRKDLHHHTFFEWSGLVFAYAIPGKDQMTKTHLYDLKDIYVLPYQHHIPLTYRGGTPKLVTSSNVPEIHVPLYQGNHRIDARLIPMGETNLRQVTFGDG
ncbi:MAG: hypothetical protein C4537_01255 [Acholeplasma sp.]|nr:MAG: hypothetical protein C4537_01255 [Acholeplasma sp.]